MNIAVLFDGAGLARLGLERAGHECVGVELNPIAHYLSQFVGSGNSVLMDATQFDLTGFDAVWASPPCQVHSCARTQGDPESVYSKDFLEWSLALKVDVLWVENVASQIPSKNAWGKLWNAAQFLEMPIQNRNRIVGGRYPDPVVYHDYRRVFKGVCNAITATEYKGCATDRRRASRDYGRRLTIEECAYHQGFEVPSEWYRPQFGMTPGYWRHELYRAIGNGVPVFMAEAFGMAALNYTKKAKLFPVKRVKSGSP